MKRPAAWMVCAGLLVVGCGTGADPPYLGRWRVNEEKTDYGPAFNFTRTASGDLRFTKGDQSYVIRLDGQEYPHPFGGMVRWKQLDDRTWQTTIEKDGKVIGDFIYRLSNDGQTLTTTPAPDRQGPTIVHRRTSGEKTGLVGFWSVKTASNSILEIGVAPDYDLVVRAGGATCKANFDGRDYPSLGPNGDPTNWSTCRISRIGDRGFTFTVNINGRAFATAARTVSEDGRTLTEIGGLVGQPQNQTIVYDRQ